MQGTPEAEPRIEYDPSVDWAKQGFSIEINPEACLTLFHGLNMSDEAIRRRTILISSETPTHPENPEFLLLTAYNEETDTQEIYPFNFWENYIREMQTVIGFAGDQFAQQMIEDAGAIVIAKGPEDHYEAATRELLKDADDLDQLMTLARYSPNDFIDGANTFLFQRYLKVFNLSFLEDAFIATDSDPNSEEIDIDPGCEAIDLKIYEGQFGIRMEPISNPTDLDIFNTPPWNEILSPN